MITEIITAIQKHLTTEISYASDSGYVDKDIDELVQSNKFPFFNVICEGWEVAEPEGMNRKAMERNIIRVLIQFATRSAKIIEAKLGNSSKAGIYDFAEDIWVALRTNPTLDGLTTDLSPTHSTDISVVEAAGNNERYFVAGAEMRIYYIKDVGL